MTTDFEFKRDDDGVKESLAQPGMLKFVNQASGAIAGAIKTRGPKRRESFFRYRDGIGVMPAVLTRQEGVVGAVVVDSPGWHLAEYGTTKMSALAPMRRGARDIAGVKFEES